MMNSETVRRLDWVDIAKGICIILVVMFHATLGLEKATGETTALNALIEWARPFRMPDFFLISGLFLAARIDKPWRSYLDSKVVHFAYFYILWLHLLLAIKAPVIIADVGLGGFIETYLWSYLDPFGSLWFIYLLAIYFTVAKLLHGVGKPLVLAAAAFLHILWLHTGVFLADEFASRFVFFYSGYVLAPYVFAFAGRAARAETIWVLAALSAWAIGNWTAVDLGLTKLPVLDLAFSGAGIAAVVATSVLLARSGFGEVIQYCGRNSISIYLAFTVFMGPVRAILLKIAPGLSGEAVAIDSMLAGIIGALALSYLVRGTWAGFLFTRPEAFKLPALEARLMALTRGAVLVKVRVLIQSEIARRCCWACGRGRIELIESALPCEAAHAHTSRSRHAHGPA